ncbi:hypothetical protein LCGC14_1266170 [marine sediment metagenome]|uniref:Uncharacterized protein n=1 Tax=marine sediment metagenome TaxID=412755 RepID=A0A0F9P2M2_9ZZZZ
MGIMPKISFETIQTVLREINITKPSISTEWATSLLAEISASNPILSGFLTTLIAQGRPDAAINSLVTYKLIETQLEVNQLEEQFNENP